MSATPHAADPDLSSAAFASGTSPGGASAARPAPAGAYATVEAAIRFLRERAREQPSLEALADALGLSPFHLQRLFGAWAGISPKRFLQVVSKEHAKAALRRSDDVLGASLEAGLSSPGRLHDLLVSCDAVSPGDVRRGGEGLEVRHGCADTPFGRAFVAQTGRGVCDLAFVEDDGAAALAQLRAEWPRARLHRDEASAGALAQRMFGAMRLDALGRASTVGRGARGAASEGRGPDGAPPALHLMLRGTNFQVKVWEALLRVPEGCVVSYAKLAGMAGVPGASRAVGAAVARNRLAVLIPCHRVIRESGELAGYRWGVERKSALLAWEAARTDRTGQAAVAAA